MSFRKRNIGLAGPNDRTASQIATSLPSRSIQPNLPGVRPSPLDGRPTTSTGTQSLDDTLAGHAGLALGSALLIEENGTTDFAGALLRYYAAEGLVQGHRVHVVGVGEQWGRELPGLVDKASVGAKEEGSVAMDKEKMKIAWRYERLGEFGAGSRGGIFLLLIGILGVHRILFLNEQRCPHVKILIISQAAPPIPNRSPSTATSEASEPATPITFCHSFDLTKRLTIPTPPTIDFTPTSLAPDPAISPYEPILTTLKKALHDHPQTIHRLIIPTLLSPALYPPHACNPTHLLPFLHTLRSLLRSNSNRLTAILTLPLSLHPRSTGLICWIEHLCDGVLELAPFPHRVELDPPGPGIGKADEKPQGMVKIHKLPVFSEKGGGGGGGDDLAFSLSRKRFMIRPYSLPPVEGDEEAQRGEAERGKMKVDVDF